MDKPIMTKIAQENSTKDVQNEKRGNCEERIL